MPGSNIDFNKDFNNDFLSPPLPGPPAPANPPPVTNKGSEDKQVRTDDYGRPFVPPIGPW